MKTNITTLHEDARARLPNKTAQSLRLVDLPPLAFLLALRVIHAWGGRQYELKAVPPAKRTVASLRFEIPWRDLQQQLCPGASARAEARVYRHLQDAAKRLFEFRAFHDGRNLLGIHFLSEVEMAADKTMFAFSLPPQFERAMRILDGAGFCQVPLSDAIALQESRHMAMLMMVCVAWHLQSKKLRTVSVEELRDRLNLTSASYSEWWRVWQKLQTAVQVINARTAFRIRLVSYAPQGKVLGVRFDVRRKGEAVSREDALAPPAKTSTKPVLMVKTQMAKLRKAIEASEQQQRPNFKPKFKQRREEGPFMSLPGEKPFVRHRAYDPAAALDATMLAAERARIHGAHPTWRPSPPTRPRELGRCYEDE